LFALIFLSITHELPPWPITVGAASSAAIFVAAAYWVLFSLFGGASLGARMANAADASRQEHHDT
jgi:mevalonate kinase